LICEKVTFSQSIRTGGYYSMIQFSGQAQH